MRSNSGAPRQLSWVYIFPLIFVAIFLLHAPLLRLPFFWDEAGFYVPAAFDLAHYHTLIPRTTMDTGHPPLPAAYLALWFTLSAWKPAVARTAQLLLAAFALTNVFLLARRLVGTGVAVASTFATALYPIFFVQSSLAHADLAAAAFTLWGIRGSVEKRKWTPQLAFSLAVLSKETAIITPVALILWELMSKGNSGVRSRLLRAGPYLIPALPLLGWLGHHHHVTGRFFGSEQFYQYNVVQAITPLRFLLALALRVWHLFGTMNMLALTAATGAAMMFPPVVKEEIVRPRIPIPVQLQFALIMLAHLVTFSLVGGALLTRYLLPAYPLVIVIGMSTLHRRIVSWEWPAAVMVVFFVFALVFDPPYRFAPEDNLTYRDFIELHATAAHFLEQHEQDKVVLTAWPATDELTKPYLGYVQRPMHILPTPDFTWQEMLRARAMRSRYQVVYLFSTKYEGNTWLHSAFWDRLNERYFDYHRDLSPEAAAQLLGGKLVFLARRKAEWVEIIEVDQSTSASSEVSLQPRYTTHQLGCSTARGCVNKSVRGQYTNKGRGRKPRPQDPTTRTKPPVESRKHPDHGNMHRRVINDVAQGRHHNRANPGNSSRLHNRSPETPEFSLPWLRSRSATELPARPLPQTQSSFAASHRQTLARNPGRRHKCRSVQRRRNAAVPVGASGES